jgi:hypothetical protein
VAGDSGLSEPGYNGGEWRGGVSAGGVIKAPSLYLLSEARQKRRNRSEAARVDGESRGLKRHFRHGTSVPLRLPGDECAVPNGFKDLTELFQRATWR